MRLTTTRRRRASAVAIATVVLLAACGQSPSASPITSPMETPSSPLPVVGALDLGALSWWRIGWRAGDEISRHDELTVGRLDGDLLLRVQYDHPIPDPTAVYIPAAGGLFVRGPQGGRILYVQQLAAGAAEIRLIDVGAAETRVLTRLPTLPIDATLSVDGRDLFLALYEPGEGTGLWRMSIDASREPQLILPPEPFDDGLPRANAVLAARAAFIAQIELSADGTRLALLECGMNCRLTVMELDSDTVDRIDDVAHAWVELDGFSVGGDVILSSDCVVLDEGVGGSCEEPDVRAASASVRRTMGFGVELPEPWRVELQPVPDRPEMSFELRAVAVNGDLRVVLEALGHFSGQG